MNEERLHLTPVHTLCIYNLHVRHFTERKLPCQQHPKHNRERVAIQLHTVCPWRWRDSCQCFQHQRHGLIADKTAIWCSSSQKLRAKILKSNQLGASTLATSLGSAVIFAETSKTSLSSMEVSRLRACAWTELSDVRSACCNRERVRMECATDFGWMFGELWMAVHYTTCDS